MGNYACIDRDGTFGARATVWAVYEHAEQAFARDDCQAIEMPDAEVGDKVHREDIGRIYPRLAKYRVRYTRTRDRVEQRDQIELVVASSEERAKQKVERMLNVLRVDAVTKLPK